MLEGALMTGKSRSSENELCHVLPRYRNKHQFQASHCSGGRLQETRVSAVSWTLHRRRKLSPAAAQRGEPWGQGRRQRHTPRICTLVHLGVDKTHASAAR